MECALQRAGGTAARTTSLVLLIDKGKHPECRDATYRTMLVVSPHLQSSPIQGEEGSCRLKWALQHVGRTQALTTSPFIATSPRQHPECREATYRRMRLELFAHTIRYSRHSWRTPHASIRPATYPLRLCSGQASTGSARGSACPPSGHRCLALATRAGIHPRTHNPPQVVACDGCVGYTW